MNIDIKGYKDQKIPNIYGTLNIWEAHSIHEAIYTCKPLSIRKA